MGQSAWAAQAGGGRGEGGRLTSLSTSMSSLSLMLLLPLPSPGQAAPELPWLALRAKPPRATATTTTTAFSAAQSGLLLRRCLRLLLLQHQRHTHLVLHVTADPHRQPHFSTSAPSPRKARWEMECAPGKDASKDTRRRTTTPRGPCALSLFPHGGRRSFLRDGAALHAGRRSSSIGRKGSASQQV